MSNKKGFTAIVLIIVVALVVSVGGYYFAKKVGYIGGDRDSHGCVAPYFWAEVVKECTKESPAEISPVNPSSNSSPKLNFTYSDGEKPWENYDAIKRTGADTPTMFVGRQVFTNNSVAAEKYLPVWKQVFQKINGMNDEYFNSHIFIEAAYANEIEVEHNFTQKIEKRFEVNYYYKVDWARKRLFDAFTYGLEGIGDEITTAEILRDLTLSFEKTKYQRILDFNTIKAVGHIASKIDVEKAVKQASPLLWLDVNKHMRLETGELAIDLYGAIDSAKNDCLEGIVMLKNAAVKFGEASCVIY